MIVLPVFGPFMAYREGFNKSATQGQKIVSAIGVDAFFKALDEFSNHDFFESRILGDTTIRILKKKDIHTKKQQGPQGHIEVPATVILLSYILMKKNRTRFRDKINRNTGFFGFSAEDWLRCLSTMNFVQKKATLFDKKPVKVQPTSILWGDAHGGEAARPINDANQEIDGQAAQTLLNVQISDAFERSRDLMGFLEPNQIAKYVGNGATSDEQQGNELEDATSRNLIFESFTTCLLTHHGYSRARGKGQPNYAPPIPRPAATGFITAMENRLCVSDVDTKLESLEELLSKAHGKLNSASENLDSRSRSNINAIDCNMDDDVIRQLDDATADAIGLSEKDAKPMILSSSMVFTSEATAKMAGFQETLKEINWMDRLPGYWENGKVVVNPDAKGRAKGFGLQAGQICGKYYSITLIT
jgi:hypothetical protein